MITPRLAVQQIPLGEHGGRLSQCAAAGSHVTVRADFSTCLNAFGPARIVREAIAGAAFSEYPDPRSTLARNAIANRINRPPDEIVVGAGASELIQAVCFAYINGKDTVLIAAPAFGEYERAAQLCGASVHTMPMMTAAEHEIGAFVSAIRRLKPKLTFVAAPSSPAGVSLAQSDIFHIAEACISCDGLLVLDQSYDSFSSAPLGVPALPGHPGVLHVRSLTKDHAIAGVRVAFAVCGSAIADALERARVPWSSSAMCQAAAVAAMTDEALLHVAETSLKLRREAARIAERCRNFGLSTVSSATHYLLIECADADAARSVILQQHQLLVRSCRSFGLPRHIRVAARAPVDNEWLLDALALLAPSARG